MKGERQTTKVGAASSRDLGRARDGAPTMNSMEFILFV